jgi:outer membrane receptor protein involved in Fe transport
MANAGITWENKYLNASVMVNYFSSQYLDEENTISSDPYTIVGLKLWKDFLKHWSANIDVQNLFDVRYIDRKGRYSLGRFITGGISYKF